MSYHNNRGRRGPLLNDPNRGMDIYAPIRDLDWAENHNHGRQYNARHNGDNRFHWNKNQNHGGYRANHYPRETEGGYRGGYHQPYQSNHSVFDLNGHVRPFDNRNIDPRLGLNTTPCRGSQQENWERKPNINEINSRNRSGDSRPPCTQPSRSSVPERSRSREATNRSKSTTNSDPPDTPKKKPTVNQITPASTKPSTSKDSEPARVEKEAEARKTKETPSKESDQNQSKKTQGVNSTPETQKSTSSLKNSPESSGNSSGGNIIISPDTFKQYANKIDSIEESNRQLQDSNQVLLKTVQELRKDICTMSEISQKSSTSKPEVPEVKNEKDSDDSDIEIIEIKVSKKRRSASPNKPSSQTNPSTKPTLPTSTSKPSTSKHKENAKTVTVDVDDLLDLMPGPDPINDSSSANNAHKPQASPVRDRYKIPKSPAKQRERTVSLEDRSDVSSFASSPSPPPLSPLSPPLRQVPINRPIYTHKVTRGASGPKACNPHQMKAARAIRPIPRPVESMRIDPTTSAPPVASTSRAASNVPFKRQRSNPEIPDRSTGPKVPSRPTASNGGPKTCLSPGDISDHHTTTHYIYIREYKKWTTNYGQQQYARDLMRRVKSRPVSVNQYICPVDHKHFKATCESSIVAHLRTCMGKDTSNKYAIEYHCRFDTSCKFVSYTQAACIIHKNL